MIKQMIKKSFRNITNLDEMNIECDYQNFRGKERDHMKLR